MAGGAIDDVFFAGLAPTDEFASTHSEHKTAKRVLAKRGYRSMAGSGLVPLPG